jgi:hypothetical protein
MNQKPNVREYFCTINYQNFLPEGIVQKYLFLKLLTITFNNSAAD